MVTELISGTPQRNRGFFASTIYLWRDDSPEYNTFGEYGQSFLLGSVESRRPHSMRHTEINKVPT